MKIKAETEYTFVVSEGEFKELYRAITEYNVKYSTFITEEIVESFEKYFDELRRSVKDVEL